ncbi:MAG: hypothetical protein ACPGOY_09200 [Rhodospirillaceae bacterium]
MARIIHAGGLGPSDTLIARPHMPKVFASVDRVKFTPVCDALSNEVGEAGTAALRKREQSRIRTALRDAGHHLFEGVLQYTGDGATLFFRSPSRAWAFAQALMNIVDRENQKGPRHFGPLRYRIGVATTEQGDTEGTDAIITRATRLQSIALPGGVSVDGNTLCALPHLERQRFGAEEVVYIKGKAYGVHRLLDSSDGASPLQLRFL